MKLKTEKRYIKTDHGKMKILLLRPEKQNGTVPGILWIHGGGYATGMAEMVYFSCGKMLAEKYGAVVISPEYRLSGKAKYPAALEDCYTALEYMYDHRKELGIGKIVAGGESAGGGLAAAVCLYARDKGKIRVSCQLPVYPMLDCFDTESSADNHGYIWNTKRNHQAWKLYLGDLYGKKEVPVYASASRETDYTGLPPCATFVLEGEPFYRETLTYVKNLQEAGIEAFVSVYPGKMHSFDLFLPWTKRAKTARKTLCGQYLQLLSGEKES